MDKVKLIRVSLPEDIGISSARILDFFEDLQKNNIKYHSIAIIKGDKVVFESYNYPYTSDTPHAMYSASKSVTSTAIGFAISEGLLSLDTLLIDIFPEYIPKKNDKKLNKLKIEHLLTMTSGKDVSLFADKNKDWIQNFFDAKWYSTPGERFKYVNENIYMLSAVLARVTGMSMTEYLTPRLYAPLGIQTPFWETDSNGIEAGGWGLYFTPEDLAKFTLCYKDNGVFGGKQVIPTGWVALATKKQADNSFCKGYGSSFGYGYCFWMNEITGSFRVDGMFSQFGIVLPEYDGCIILTAGHPDSVGPVRSCIWRHFPKLLEETSCDSNKEIILALSKYKNPPPKLLPVSIRPGLEKDIDGKIIRFNTSRIRGLVGIPLSILPLPIIFMSQDKGGNINNIRLEFYEKELAFSWTEANRAYRIRCGLNGDCISQKVRIASQDFTILALASWVEEDCLELWLKPVEAVASRQIKLHFKRNKIRLTVCSEPSMKELIFDIADGAFPDMFSSKVVLALARFGAKKAYRLLEPKLKGKFL